jgi:alpha-N-arabinofuranosidase
VALVLDLKENNNMKSITLAMLGGWMFAAGAALAGPQVAVTIDVAKPGPVISKNIYGQAAEYPGAGSGMWVGPESAIPNIKGWRRDVVGALKDLHVPLLRWPGACFADQYHWRDGIGQPGKRPVRINADGSEDRNAVGTHEFFDLVELIGADAHISGNVGTGTVREAAEWVEYMTADGESTLARLRTQNGHPQPFKVAFFGIGNDAGGCGGNMTPEYYADLYNQFAVFVKARSGETPRLVASGGDLDWTESLGRKSRIRDYRNGISLRYSAVPVRVRDGQGGEAQWISTLKAALRWDEIIGQHAAKLDTHDPGKKLFLVIDEWGNWHDPAPSTHPGVSATPNSLRDALAAALSFHIFHAHADRVRMAHRAQAVNLPQAIIMVDGGRMVLTPTYHAFRMYAPFQNATSLPVTLADNPQYSMGGIAIPTVSASAARGQDGRLYLGLINTHPSKDVEVAVKVAGAVVKSASGSVLSAPALDAHNTFASPRTVQPVPFRPSVEKGGLTVKMPARAIVVLGIAE